MRPLLNTAAGSSGGKIIKMMVIHLLLGLLRGIMQQNIVDGGIERF